MAVHRTDNSSREGEITQSEITQWLQRWQGGDLEARDLLIERIYPQLRKLAGRRLNQRPSKLAIQTTEVIHELYLKLIDQQRVHWNDRSHFFAVAGRLLRRIIVDHERHRSRQKRGGGIGHLTINAGLPHEISPQGVDVVALDEALEKLKSIDERASQVVELRYFAGLTHDETAEVMAIGRATVARSWRFARAWLRQQLGGAAA